MAIKCFKIKNRKQTKILKGQCNKKGIEKLLNQGYSVSKITTNGNKSQIETFSPMTKEQAIKQHRKIWGGKIPF